MKWARDEIPEIHTTELDLITEWRRQHKGEPITAKNSLDLSNALHKIFQYTKSEYTGRLDRTDRSPHNRFANADGVHITPRRGTFMDSSDEDMSLSTDEYDDEQYDYRQSPEYRRRKNAYQQEDSDVTPWI